MKLWKDFVQHIIVVIGILVGLSTGVPTNTDIQQDGSYQFSISRKTSSYGFATNQKTKSRRVTIQSLNKLDIDSALGVLVTKFELVSPEKHRFENIPKFYTVTTRSSYNQDKKKQVVLERYMWDEYQVLQYLQKLFSSPDNRLIMGEEGVTEVFKVFPPEAKGESPAKQFTFIAEFWGERFDHWEKTHGQDLRNQSSALDIARLILRMAKGVGALHHQNIVHRNIRPESFVINEQRQIKIMDFSYSIRLEGKTTLHLNDAKFEGDPAYAAPETQPPNNALITDPKELYARDMWSMGVLMVRLFSGQFPPGEVLPGYKYFADSSASTRIPKVIGRVLAPIKDFVDNHYNTLQECYMDGYCNLLHKDYKVPKELASIIRKCLKQKWEERAVIDEVIKVFASYIVF